MTRAYKKAAEKSAFVEQQRADLRLKYVAFELYSIIDFLKRNRYPVESIRELAKSLTIVASVEGKLRRG